MKTPDARKIFQAWHAGQGAKIKGARAMPVYDHCVLLAKDLAKAAAERYETLILTAEQISLCEQAALSQARVTRFGALPQSADEWHAQNAKIREAWALEMPGKDAAE